MAIEWRPTNPLREEGKASSGPHKSSQSGSIPDPATCEHNHLTEFGHLCKDCGARFSHHGHRMLEPPAPVQLTLTMEQVELLEGIHKALGHFIESVKRGPNRRSGT